MDFFIAISPLKYGLVRLRPANLARHIPCVDRLVPALEVNLVMIAHTAHIAATGIVELITMAVSDVTGPKSDGAGHHPHQQNE